MGKVESDGTFAWTSLSHLRPSKENEIIGTIGGAKSFTYSCFNAAHENERRTSSFGFVRLTDIMKKPEVELLTCCARTGIGTETADRIKALISGKLDWQVLLRLAVSHGVMPLLFTTLNSIPCDTIPKDFTASLRNLFFRNTSRNLMMAGELARIMELFRTNHISAVCYKGPSLAVLAYGDLSLRQFGDLDILVHERHVSTARDLTLSLGYSQILQLASSWEAASIQCQLQSHWEYKFVNPQGVVIEIHWPTHGTPCSYFSRMNHPWDNVEMVPIGKTVVPTTRAEDLLLTLCVHGTRHSWAKLMWVCDVSELIRAKKSLDWQLLFRQAYSTGNERMLYLGLLLAHLLLETELPDNVLGSIQKDPKAGQLAADMIDKLTGESADKSTMPFFAFHYKTLTKPMDKILYAIHLLRLSVSPTENESSLIALPAPLSFLYRILRPARLAAKYGIRLVRHGRSLPPPQ